jgi:hypothetical protein
MNSQSKAKVASSNSRKKLHNALLKSRTRKGKQYHASTFSFPQIFHVIKQASKIHQASPQTIQVPATVVFTK